MFIYEALISIRKKRREGGRSHELLQDKRSRVLKIGQFYLSVFSVKKSAIHLPKQKIDADSD